MHDYCDGSIETGTTAAFPSARVTLFYSIINFALQNIPLISAFGGKQTLITVIAERS